MLKPWNGLWLLALVVLTGCRSVPAASPSRFSHFTGLDKFSAFTRSAGASGETVLLSPVITSTIAWNQLIVSWNADAAPGTFVKIEAAARIAGGLTKFYTIGTWSPDNRRFVRASLRNQADADGTVDTDTLIVNQPADAAQLRVTLGGTNQLTPALKFLGLSFANTRVPPAARPPNHAAWGKIIATPERSQLGYPGGQGWCSPTSLSMILSRWAQVLERPEMSLPVPAVAAAVYDQSFAGTGNWPFNTAFAGSFAGLRGYVTRFDDLSEVEEWIAAGIPVVLSARWDWLLPGRPVDNDGHLIVCIGFTNDGDVVINDPATHFDRGETVRRVYTRANVIHAWTKSHNTVYLVYPVGAAIPANRYGQW